jgi:predicted exporter
MKSELHGKEWYLTMALFQVFVGGLAGIVAPTLVVSMGISYLITLGFSLLVIAIGIAIGWIIAFFSEKVTVYRETHPLLK